MKRTFGMLFGLLLTSSTLILGCTGNLMAKNSAEAITGKKWLLTSMNGERTPDNIKIYAEFIKEDGRAGYLISGSSGCNMFRGGANITDKNLKVQHLLSTRMACKTPENVMETESKFLRALENSTSFGIEPSSLNMIDAAGKTILTFRAEK